ncbi:MAG: hypothetical protein O3A87_00065 [Verrucomicrobia bacterium]|nr:hypothetical protein [Verrucomicrobiota bacterium]MDA1004861.1 hypothetical protein [Verrucomicrobiota bacterium]
MDNTTNTAHVSPHIFVRPGLPMEHPRGITDLMLADAEILRRSPAVFAEHRC